MGEGGEEEVFEEEGGGEFNASAYADGYDRKE